MAVTKVNFAGPKVLLEVDGKALEMPWETALELASALRSMAKKAEEYANANKIIADGAVLMRAGFPLGLTDNQAMKAEIKKEAQWNGDLRRYMPTPSIKSTEVLGTPSVLQPVTVEQKLRAMTEMQRAELRRILLEGGR